MAEQTYDPKTFNRKFEETFGYLTPEQFPTIDWADQDQIEMLYPDYRREFIAATKNQVGRKELSKKVEIDDFNLLPPFGGEPLFKGAKLYIENNKRCAVYGENGSGKTSIFVALAGGKVKDFPKYIHTHHMKELEHNAAADDVSVFDTVMCSHPMRRVLLCMEELVFPKEIAAAEAAGKAERVTKLKENLETCKRHMKAIDGYTGEKRAKQMLRVLGFDEVGDKAPLSSLSGGLRMRVALASAFFIDPDVLLLDEPTNHLDMPSVLWLENKLRSYKGSFLLVTHDRTLLENVVTSVMLLQDQKIEYFAMGFKEFEKKKVELDNDRDKRIEKFLFMNRNCDPSDPAYRVKMKHIAWQTRRQDRLVLLAGKFTFQAPANLPCADGVEQKDVVLLDVKDVRFSYDVAKGLPFIFDNPISYTVTVGTRVGIMGPNGAGKSTFLKLITGKLVPVTGTITTNPDFVLAYFGQHSTKELQMDKTPMEFMIASFPDANEGAIKSHLAKTSIGGDLQQSRMQDLSFSQRSCVIFSKLTFVPPHLLIMDEPTNFLDLDSVDSLISAANKFGGGLIVVTHNRDFLKRTAKTFLSIVPDAFLEFKTMKEAERATYSFITAMEEGKQIDAKLAIAQNRGGGAIHTDEYLAESKARLDEQQAIAAAKEAEKKALEDAAAKKIADREAKLAAKKAAQKLDWVVGDKAWVAKPGGKGAFVECVVKRVIPGMGISVEMEGGKAVMTEAKNLKEEKPEEEAKPAGKGAPAGGAKGAPAGGGRGGATAGGRGGATGGRGGRGGK